MPRGRHVWALRDGRENEARGTLALIEEHALKVICEFLYNAQVPQK